MKGWCECIKPGIRGGERKKRRWYKMKGGRRKEEQSVGRFIYRDIRWKLEKGRKKQRARRGCREGRKQ